jgi:hypothetical protein
MLIYSPSTSVFAVLLFLLVGMLDLYLFTASLRLALGLIPAARTSNGFCLLVEFVDPFPTYLRLQFNKICGASTPLGIVWFIVFTAVLIVRQIAAYLLHAT